MRFPREAFDNLKRPVYITRRCLFSRSVTHTGLWFRFQRPCDTLGSGKEFGRAFDDVIDELPGLCNEDLARLQTLYRRSNLRIVK